VANWKPGQLIIDRTLVRPPVDLKPGVYELRWELFDRDSQERRSLLSAAVGVEDTEIRVGSIEVTDSAPRGVAGLAWT
jgi:hypothetical protein